MSNLTLIDWRLVGFSALWVAGLGLDLAALSWADFEATRLHVRLRERLGRPRCQVAVNVGLLLFCLGLTGSAGAAWEQIVWIGLAALFAYQAWRARRLSKSDAHGARD